MTTAIRTAAPDDRPAVERLLHDAGLPAAGIGRLVDAGDVLVAHEPASGVIGCVGLEPAGRDVLLRSLAVAADRRGAGIGSHLVAAALTAVPPGSEVWVLTETAEAFLTARGFTPVDRSAVTGPVTATELWSSACPASAVALRRDAEAL